MFHNGYYNRTSGWSTIEAEFNSAWNCASRYKVTSIDKKYIEFTKQHLNAHPVTSDGPVFVQPPNGLFIPQPFEPDKTISLTDNDYIGMHADDIRKMMQEANAKQIYIKASCGSGKTKYIIDEFRRSDKAIVVAHLNSIKYSNYEAIFKREEIKYQSPSLGKLVKLLKDKQADISHLLLGWQQFAELLAIGFDLSSYNVFIDEAHAFQTEVNYRHCHIKTIVSYIDKVPRLTLVSATPLGEHEVLLTDPNALRLEFTKKKDYTECYYYMANTRESLKGSLPATIVNAIDLIVSKGNSNPKFAILDNMNHKSYPQLLEGKDYIHLHSAAKNTPDVIEIMKSQELKQQILVSTTYGKEGIEYKNEVEDLIVFVPAYGDVTQSSIEQFINRFRHKKHVDVFLFQVNSVADSKYDDCLLKQTMLLASGGRISDEHMPAYLLAIDKMFSQKDETASLCFSELIKDIPQNERVLKLISFFCHNILENNVSSKSNRERMYPGIRTVTIEYCDSKNLATKEKFEDVDRLLSQRDAIQRYLLLAANMSDGVIYQTMIKDNLIERQETAISENNVESAFDSIFDCALDAVEDPTRLPPSCTIEVANKIAYVKTRINVIAKVVKMVSGQESPVFVDDNTWAFLCLLKNRQGIVNWTQGYRLISSINEATRTNWLLKQLTKLEYNGHTMSLDDCYRDIDWRAVKRIKGGDNREKGKSVGKAIGKAKHFKFCLVNDETILFQTVDEMYKYAQDRFGCKLNFPTFKNKWKHQGWFMKRVR